MISHILYRYGITEITKFTRRFNFIEYKIDDPGFVKKRGDRL